MKNNINSEKASESNIIGYIADKEKIAFIGDFNKDYWKQQFKNEFYKFVFLEKQDITKKLLTDYYYIFVSDLKKHSLLFTYDSYDGQVCINVNIQKGSLDNCANALATVGCGFIGMDLADLESALGHGVHPATYYNNLTISEAKELKIKYCNKTGMYFIIHAPQNANLEKIDSISSEIANLCDPNANILWDVRFDRGITDYALDIFISGVNLTNKCTKRRKS